MAGCHGQSFQRDGRDVNLEEKCGLLGCVSAQADQDHCAWKK